MTEPREEPVNVTGITDEHGAIESWFTAWIAVNTIGCSVLTVFGMTLDAAYLPLIILMEVLLLVWLGYLVVRRYPVSNVLTWWRLRHQQRRAVAFSLSMAFIVSLAASQDTAPGLPGIGKPKDPTGLLLGERSWRLESMDQVDLDQHWGLDEGVLFTGAMPSGEGPGVAELHQSLDLRTGFRLEFDAVVWVDEPEGQPRFEVQIGSAATIALCGRDPNVLALRRGTDAGERRGPRREYPGPVLPQGRWIHVLVEMRYLGPRRCEVCVEVDGLEPFSSEVRIDQHLIQSAKQVRFLAQELEVQVCGVEIHALQ